jgi:hypothetical protein
MLKNLLQLSFRKARLFAKGISATYDGILTLSGAFRALRMLNAL